MMELVLKNVLMLSSLVKEEHNPHKVSITFSITKKIG